MTTRDSDEVEGKPDRDAMPTGALTSPVATTVVDESPNWRNRREHGWAFIVILVALAIVAFVARDALTQYFGVARNAAATPESRLPPAARAPVDPTQASPVVAAPMERARSVEGVVQQQADDLAKRIEREAR